MVLTRTFDAPKERLWRAWSDADEVMRWWGPQGFTSPTCRMDLREGGTTLVCMRSAQGWELYNTWAPAELGLPPGIPEDVLHVVSLRSIDDATTELTVHEFGYPDAQTVEISRTGMEQCLDKMEASLTTS